MEAEVMSVAPLAMSLCVPKEWSNEQISVFAESKEASGVSTGWKVRPDAEDYPERVECAKDKNKVHVVVVV